MHEDVAAIMILTREEYRRIWQMLEELENMMWKIKSQNEGELQRDE